RLTGRGIRGDVDGDQRARPTAPLVVALPAGTAVTAAQALPVALLGLIVAMAARRAIGVENAGARLLLDELQETDVAGELCRGGGAASASRKEPAANTAAEKNCREADANENGERSRDVRLHEWPSPLLPATALRTSRASKRIRGRRMPLERSPRPQLRRRDAQ